MNEAQNIMRIVLMAVLVICGYIFLFLEVKRKSENEGAIKLIGIVLFVIYAMIMLPLLYILSRMGSMDLMLMALLVLFSCAGFILAVRELFTHFYEIRKGVAGLLILYIIAIIYITLLSRDEEVSARVVLSFDSFGKAFENRSLQPLEHLWMNLLMFLPVGFLFPLMNPRRFARLSLVLPFGLTLSTMIETMQMLLKLGQCDVEDMLANTLGTFAGYVAFRVYYKVTGGEEEFEEDGVETEGSEGQEWEEERYNH